MKKSIVIGCLASLALTGVAQAQINVVRQPLPEYQSLQEVPLEFTKDGVMKAQHIRPGDVSPEEYQALLDEADRVRRYQTNGQTTGSYAFDDKYNRNVPASPTSAVPAPIASAPTYSRQLPLYEAPRTQPQYTGQTESYASAPSVERQSHYVVKGDTLFSISRAYGLTVADVKSANNLRSNIINEGQFLAIPGRYATATNRSTRIDPSDRLSAPTYARSSDPMFSTPPSSGIYAVLPGDTMYSIARRACVRVDSLQRRNASVEATDLQPGQRLTMPPGHCL